MLPLAGDHLAKRDFESGWSGTEVCSDVWTSADVPNKIVLTVEPPVTKPSREIFKIMANGSDAAIVTAQVVDAQGVLCVLRPK